MLAACCGAGGGTSASSARAASSSLRFSATFALCMRKPTQRTPVTRTEPMTPVRSGAVGLMPLRWMSRGRRLTARI